MSAKKKRAFVEKQPKSIEQESQPSPDFTIVYSASDKASLAGNEKPSVWRLATLLGQFTVHKLAINKKSYQQFLKQETASDLVTMSLCKNNAFVEIRLKCRGDGGWHDSTFSFEVSVDKTMLLRKSRDYPAEISEKKEEVEFTSFIREIGGNLADEPLLAQAIQKVLPQWRDMIAEILESELNEYRAKEDYTEQEKSSVAALSAFFEVFECCFKYVLAY